jgi:hypothetical protein
MNAAVIPATLDPNARSNGEISLIISDGPAASIVYKSTSAQSGPYSKRFSDDENLMEDKLIGSVTQPTKPSCWNSGYVPWGCPKKI